MKNFLQRLIQKLKRSSSSLSPSDDSALISRGTRSFKDNIASQLKRLSASAKAKGKINALTSKSLPFSWDEIIGHFFSPHNRPIFHRVFLVFFSISLSYFCAKVVIYFISPDSEIQPQVMRGSAMMTPPISRDAFQAVRDTNLFNAKLDEFDTGANNKKDKVELICDKSSKKSSLPIKLLQTTVMQDELKSLASVEVKGMRDIAMIRTGENIESLAKLDKIERQRLIVKNFRSGDCEYIESDEMGDDSRLNSRFDVLSPMEGNKLIAANRPDAIKQDGNNFKIKKDYRDNMLQDIGQVLTQAKAVQMRNPDGTLSFQMTEVVPGSIYAHLNIQNGDVIKSINGEPIKDLNQLMSLFGNIKNVDNIQLGVVKDGQEQNMDFSFE